ncbi:hypothetical protein lbkm_0303 [Lachnospiraceae bacterium KM106-2]|nr:hypothetical protein lbkm_0303 [Lachnospiraceae bacterium KM106-2]
MIFSAEDSEYYDEWLNRDTDIADMSLEEYDYLRTVEEYGYDCKDLDSTYLEKFI